MEDQQTLEPAAVSASPRTARDIFIGPFGLRAGWSLLIYIVLLVCSFQAIRIVHNRIAHPHTTKTVAATPTPKPDPSAPTPVRSSMTQEFVIFADVLFVSCIMALIERRRLSAFGLGGVRSMPRFLAGTLWGLIAMGLLVATLRISHFLSFDARLDYGPAILGWGAAQLLLFLLVGLLEEYIFRGYIQFTLTRAFVWMGNHIAPTHARTVAFWIASFFTSAVFLLAHTGNSGEDKFGLLTVFLAGLVFVIALWRTGSLWWAIGFHMAWDWSQSFIYGVPDSGGLVQGRLFATHASGNPLLSGGTVGPEGSLFVIPVLLLVLVVLFFFTATSPQPSLEPKPAKSPRLPLAAPETPPLIA